jgi:hypothetical protein
MADNVDVTPGSGATIAADEITDPTLGTVKVQVVKVMDATLGGTNKLIIDANGAATISGSTTLIDIALPSSGTVTVNVTGATSNIIVVPSTATGKVVITDLIISNGATAGNVSFGEGDTTIGTTKIQPLYFAANAGMSKKFGNPMELTATNNFLATANSVGSLTIFATYFVRA